MKFAPVDVIAEELRNGRFIIIIDDEESGNEADLCLAADFVTPEGINFMATHGRGLITLAMTGERLDELEIPLMVSGSTSQQGTAFCVSIEACRDITSGISAKDRATTIRTVLNPATRPSDLTRPGHIFPLRASDGGVLHRAGQTEASVDLARISGLYPAAVICEILDDHGHLADKQCIADFAEKHNLKIIDVASVIDYRKRHEILVRRVASPSMPTRFGDFTMILYENELDNCQHLALTAGNYAECDPVLVRVHSECLTGDIFGSLRCDCGPQLHRALQMIAEEGCGVLLYLRQEGRGIGLQSKLKAYELQDEGHDTVDANINLGYKDDERDYGIGAQILYDLGVRRMRLLTNNPRKFIALRGYGLEIVERVAIEIPPSEHNFNYLATKKRRLGHLLDEV